MAVTLLKVTLTQNNSETSSNQGDYSFNSPGFYNNFTPGIAYFPTSSIAVVRDHQTNSFGGHIRTTTFWDIKTG